ncbi:Aste57867_3210 [Aphanomyces stellatus]|uniref:Aste57867_3210 protein n=1 Tax=Aphanomyces stellatus TaxID=120398 RepID=A0A485KEH1_9STRA|nr:hypothetical protein As57867_003200 [Aphanomyces stellatus]VFT80384.1 Aste57867_3210 [Aphanomyces stellatus]
MSADYGAHATPRSRTVNPSEGTGAPLAYEEAYIDLDAVATNHPLSKIVPRDVRTSAGLTVQSVIVQRRTFGRNELSPPKRDSLIIVFLKQFADMFAILLIVAGVLSLVSWFADTTVMLNLYLALVLFGIVVLNALIGFSQEVSSSKIMDSFKNMLPPKCTVVRDGSQCNIDAQDLVVGDLVWVNNGDKVPADIRLLLSTNLKVECSSLTGESEPVRCSNSTMERSVRPLEATNIIFNGSMCHDGSALGLVLSVGDSTVIGRIATLASSAARRKSTMEIEVGAFVKFITVISLTMGLAFFGIGVWRTQGKGVVNLIVNGFIVVMVANVPQGLPATVTSLLAIAAKKLSKHNVLVKRLDCVETLGSMTLIATDKTGTLTKNVMTVTDIWMGREFHRHQADTVHYFTDSAVDFLRDGTPPALVYRAACLCNKATLEANAPVPTSPPFVIPVTKGVTPLQRTNSFLRTQAVLQRKYTGNASDIALLRYCDTLFPSETTREAFPPVFEIPFNSTNKFQIAVVRSLNLGEEEEFDAYIKGAPEVVLGKCSHFVQPDGSVSPVDPEVTAEFMKAYEMFGKNGRRVLAVGTKLGFTKKEAAFDVEASNVPLDQFTFIGLIAIMDPPRDDVPQAIETCHRAGVKVFMVTGDHPLTARAIANQIGLLDDKAATLELVDMSSLPCGVKLGTVPSNWHDMECAVIHGSVVDLLSTAQWDCILSKSALVFARTTPQNKLDIVKQSQARGEIVGVTGDGVNDAPALKRADVGVAMGKNGSDVAREAADIVLMDDSFSSFVLGIKQGRTIFDNLLKTVAYTLAHLCPEIIPVLLSVAIGMPAGLSSLQVLSIDLGTELCPAISLAHEPPEAGLMKRPPRNLKTERLVSKALLIYSYLLVGMVESLGALLAYALVYQKYDISLASLINTSDIYWMSGAPEFCLPHSPAVCFSDAEQVRISNLARSSWYIVTVMSQSFHIWLCKTRTESVFSAGVFSNHVMIYGVVVEWSLLVLLVYVPMVQDVMQAGTASWEPWVISVGVGCVVWGYSEFTKNKIRTNGYSPALRSYFAW